MYSLRKLVWAAYIVVGVFLAIIIALGINQYLLSNRYNKLIEQSERAIFQFATIRESVTECLIERNWEKLDRAIPDIEKLNSELVRLQEHSLVPTEYKLALVERVDLAGIIISARRLAVGTNESGEILNLQKQIRSLAEHLLQFDRIIVSQARSRILNFQMVIIGTMGVIIALASFSLNRLYGNTVVPLLRISDQLQSAGQLNEEVTSGPEVSLEVAELIEGIKAVARVDQTVIPSLESSERDLQQSIIADVVNETTNRLNGIINFAQIIVDDERQNLSTEDKEMLHKIIENGSHIAKTWQNISKEG